MATKHTSDGQGWQAITQHPLFGTVVPVWLAATFALSTLAIRGQLIERLVLSSQLDLILPMATPPLGVTARLMLAVAFGLLGGLIGWIAVRKMTQRQTFNQNSWQQPRGEAPREVAPLRRRSADAHPDFPARQPIQAHAELGEHGFDNAPPAVDKRESAAQAEAAPRHAPPPPVAESWQVLHDVLPPPPPAEEPSWDWKPQGPVAAESAPASTKPALTQSVLAELTPSEPVAEAPVSQPFRFFQIDPSPVAAPVAAPVTAPVEAAPFTPEPAPVAFAQAPVEQAHIEQPVAEQPALAKAHGGFHALTLEGPSAAEHIASASLESLSHVELLERLALALQRHQTTVQNAQSVAAEPALAPAPDGTGDALRAALASLRDVK